MSGFNMLYIKYVPRWKWFRPPLWKIFMWAYRVDDATYFTNCYPVSMNHDPGVVDVTFTATPYADIVVPDEEVESIYDAYMHWLRGLGEK